MLPKTSNKESVRRTTVVLSIYKPNIDWLTDQISSLRYQSRMQSEVLVRFDGNINQKIYFDSQIKVLSDQKHVGPGRSYMELIDKCDDTLVAFCDQDDFWFPDKLTTLYESIMENSGPALSYCGYTIIDSSGQLIGSREPSRKTTKFTFLFRNTIPGCTMLLNQNAVKLLKRSKPYFPENGIHDWWTALLISLIGVMAPVPEPLISYRLHSLNTIGVSTSYSARKANLLSRIDTIDKSIHQLDKMLEYLETIETPENITNFLRSIVTGAYANRFVRLMTLIRLGIFKSSLREIVFTVLLYLLPRKLSK